MKKRIYLLALPLLGVVVLAAVLMQRKDVETAPSATVMPLTRLDHFVTIAAEINSKGPYHFVVDTGAAGAMRIDPQLADVLHLRRTGTARDGDPSGRNQAQVPVVQVGSVEVGGVKFYDIEATAGGQLPGVQTDGVIGLGLFLGWTVTLDYPKQELRLSHESLSVSGDHVTGFTTEHGVPQVSINAAGQSLKADIDTGSPALLSVPSSADLPFRSQPQVSGQGQTVTGTFEIRSADLNGDVLVAGWPLSNPTVDIADRFPGANLGSRFLRQYAVTFDLPNRRVEFEK